jgi:uncharacterized protein
MQPYILPAVAIAAPWLTSRIIKFILDARSNEKKTSLDYIFHDGGMPSNHTALVMGLTTTAFLETGFSLMFMAVGVFAFIVAHDAMKIRYEAGRHAALLNEIYSKKKGFEKLNTRLGHTFNEVFIGGLIGVIMPIIIYSLAAV